MSALPIPALQAVLGRPRREALAAFSGLGWRPWSRPAVLDAALVRRLNLDLSEPDVAFLVAGAPRAVARIEVDGDGLAVLLELTAVEPAEPQAVAEAMLPRAPGEPRRGGGGAAREWIWGPESGLDARVAGEPVRLWIAAEAAQGDRLWLVGSLVRRAGDDEA